MPLHFTNSRHRLHHLYTELDWWDGHLHCRYKTHSNLFQINLSPRCDLLLTSDPGLRIIKSKCLTSTQFILTHTTTYSYAANLLAATVSVGEGGETKVSTGARIYLLLHSSLNIYHSEQIS
jgi:hypothetical protein